jgi:hypothetical protein
VAPPGRRTPAPERLRANEPTQPPSLPGLTHPRTVPRAAAAPRRDDESHSVLDRSPGPTAPHAPSPQPPPSPAANEPTLIAAPPIVEPLPPAPLPHTLLAQPPAPSPLSPLSPLPPQPPPFPPLPPLSYQAPPPGTYPVWGGVQPQHPGRGASPTAQDLYERPMIPQRPSTPHVAGFGRPRRPMLQPWMLVVGALLMAALAFAITRAFIAG